MRILICAQEAPLPPPTGFRLQLSALVAELRKKHEVRVLALHWPEQQVPATVNDMRLVPKRADRLPGRLKALARATVSGRPLAADPLAAYLRSALREELSVFDPDVVHVSLGMLAGLADDLDGRPSVLAALDAAHLNIEAKMQLARGPRRWLLDREARRVRRFEANQYGRFGCVTVVSEQDREVLAKLDPRLNVAVIPLGVDSDAYAPAAELPADKARIVFTGVMRYPPNVSAAEFLARKVMPRVRAAWPGARLCIVGRDPAERVRALALADEVDVVGEVPDLRPWLATSRVYACPMVSGTGIKNKLLEAMSCGLPCVVTPLALQGLRAEPSRELLVGAGEEDFATQLVRVLQDDDLASRLGRAAREYVRSQHSWEAFGDAYVRTYQAVVEAQATR